MIDNKIMEEQRNYGVDLLRIVSMLMIVGLHVIGHGGVLDATHVAYVKYGTAWLLEIAFYCAVNCFAIISGYVGVKGSFKIKNIILLWCQVAFYSVMITVVFTIAGRELDIRQLVQSFFPVLSYQYWYFTAYFALFFLMPLINLFVLNLEKQALVFFSLVFLALFSVLPTFTPLDIFCTASGYSVIWLMVMYFIGACIRIVEPEDIKLSKCIFGYNILITVTAAVKLGFLLIDRRDISNTLVSYTSPTMAGCAILLFLLCYRLKISSKLIKWIKLFSPLSFGVYLIHSHPLVFEKLLKNRFAVYAQKNVFMMVLSIIATIFAIYFLCSLLEWLRIRFFSLLRVWKIAERIQEKIYKKMGFLSKV